MIRTDGTPTIACPKPKDDGGNTPERIDEQIAWLAGIAPAGTLAETLASNDTALD